uniref:Uncharacterized protein n=1 Tax=Oryza nivara TaxID=4536 RepID=A0A0E0H4S6_ORYNI
MSTVGPVCQLNIPFSSSFFLPFPRVMRGNGYRLPRKAAVELCVSETTTEPYFSHFLRRRSSLSLSLSLRRSALESKRRAGGRGDRSSREQAASGRPSRRRKSALEAGGNERETAATLAVMPPCRRALFPDFSPRRRRLPVRVSGDEAGGDGCSGSTRARGGRRWRRRLPPRASGDEEGGDGGGGSRAREWATTAATGPKRQAREAGADGGE